MIDRGPMLAVQMDLLTSDLGLLVTLAGILAVLIAAAITIRTSRGEGEPVARWRYRESRHEAPRLHQLREEMPVPPARRRADPRTARRMARLLIGIAVLLPVLMLLAWTVQPADSMPMFREPPWFAAALPWVAAAVYLFGLGWMIRIYRADPEPDPQTWRYRSEP
jgi:hypothetical protein